MGVNPFHPLESSHLAGIFPTSAVTGTQHVFCDAAVKGFTAVAFLRGDNGQRDSAEGGGDLARGGAGVSPAGHPAHPAHSDGGSLPREQGDGDVAVQVDGSLQLDRWRTVGSVSREGTNKFSDRGTRPTFISIMSLLLVVLLYSGWGIRSWGRIPCSVPS